MERNDKICRNHQTGIQPCSGRLWLQVLVKIRGDNYCAIRAAFCSMVLNSNVLEPSIETAMQKLDSLHRTEPALICSWTFANRFPSVQNKEKYEKLCVCLDTYKNTTNYVIISLTGESS
ncbi:hypothetical protein EB796_018532 [Bugula neritina]|uniref:Uncharacterized protein n=1 Tax=Bugula neritina TaxID=10212 RepID=A0A7J7JCS6_BUGNE|nr:hypothetical protein EB796_018532 [Bugula neritina]